MSLVSPVRYAYLGPEGTFTEAAVRTLGDPEQASYLPMPSVPAALEAVRQGEADSALVPLENSIEGPVPITLDELATGELLLITREVLLPVTFAVMARPGVELAAVTRIGTHPHAEAQCRRWLSAHATNATVVPTLSTAAAAAALADGNAAFQAAIAAPQAAERYQLTLLAQGVGDNPRAVTRFLLLSKPGSLTAPTSADKTSLVAFIADDHPGALLEILEQFAVRGVNLTRIESRPTGDGLGRYCFSIDCEGHIQDARVGEVLMGLRRVCPRVRFLGSYPRADGAQPALQRGTSNQEFSDATAWLDQLRQDTNPIG